MSLRAFNEMFPDEDAASWPDQRGQRVGGGLGVGEVLEDADAQDRVGAAVAEWQGADVARQGLDTRARLDGEVPGMSDPRRVHVEGHHMEIGGGEGQRGVDLAVPAADMDEAPAGIAA